MRSRRASLLYSIAGRAISLAPKEAATQETAWDYRKDYRLLGDDFLSSPIGFRMPSFARPRQNADQADFGRAALAARKLIIELGAALGAAASLAFELELGTGTSANHGNLLRADSTHSNK